jgi:hypothetical protein
LLDSAESEDLPELPNWPRRGSAGCGCHDRIVVAVSTLCAGERRAMKS